MKVFKVACLGFLFVSLFAMAAVTVPEGDPLASALEAFLNIKSLSPLGIASAVVVVLVQLVKKYFPGFEYYDVVVVLGGLTYGVLQAILSGSSVGQALLFILVTSGGAMMLYDLFKTPVNALFKVKK